MCVWQITMQAVHSQRTSDWHCRLDRKIRQMWQLRMRIWILWKMILQYFLIKSQKPLITKRWIFMCPDLRISAIRHRSLIRTAAKIMTENLSVMMGVPCLMEVGRWKNWKQLLGVPIITHWKKQAVSLQTLPEIRSVWTDFAMWKKDPQDAAWQGHT